MSLFILGSCSKITRNIILELSRRKQYQSITLVDLLPTYAFHHRYYTLKRQLDQHNYSVKIQLQKLIQKKNIYDGLSEYSDVLYVTHDYYQHVISKTKLMTTLAQLSTSKNSVYYATPMQYDHYGFDNPQQNYIQAEKQVFNLNPLSTIIRSDVQDDTELIAYLHLTRKPISIEKNDDKKEKQFRPKIVSSQQYAILVADTMQKKVRGKKIVLRGEQSINWQTVKPNLFLTPIDFQGSKINIFNFVAKYHKVVDEGFKVFQQN